VAQYSSPEYSLSDLSGVDHKRQPLAAGDPLLTHCRADRNFHKRYFRDKGYAGREFEHSAADLDATIIRPRRKDEPGKTPHLAPIRQRIESIFQTCKDLLTLERHGARTLHGLTTRISTRFLALAAAISLNHRLGRPPRALIDYIA
jgi:hypothetical protein